MMQLAEIQSLLAARAYTCEENLDKVVIEFGCASDLMSDVLAFSRAGAVLLTGLVNMQTIQTAFIAEISAVVLVRGKKPLPDMVVLAAERGLPLLSSPYSMYEACGMLYAQGLPSTMERLPDGERHSG
jgi:predicted transcriptional regulator